MAKYVDLTGLGHFLSKVQGWANGLFVTKTTTVNGHALSGNVTITKNDIGLGNVSNEAAIPASAKGTANGVATLGSDSKLTASQLPALKTVNGQSVVGSGNISIDLSLYKVVEELPTQDVDVNKIYLLPSDTSGTNNEYTEYMYVNGKWETFGTYTAAVDLTPYVKFTDVATSSKAGAMSAADKSKLDGLKNYSLPKATTSALGGIQIGYTENGKNYPVELDSNGKAFVNVPWANTTYNVATTSANGLMSSADKSKLDGVAANATADSAVSTSEIDGLFD